MSRDISSMSMEELRQEAERLETSIESTSVLITVLKQPLKRGKDPSLRKKFDDQAATLIAQKEESSTRFQMIRGQMLKLQLQAAGGIFGFDQFNRGSDPNAFSQPTGLKTTRGATPQKISKYATVVKKLLDVSEEIVDIAGPFLKRSTQKSAAFSRDEEPSTQALVKPLVYFETLMTAPALALIQQEALNKDEPPIYNELRSIAHDREGESVGGTRWISSRVDEDKVRRLNTMVNCRSQDSDSTASMVVGGITAPQRITLWENNSVLKWRMIDETFRNQEEFSLVESAIYASTATWNRIAPGGVTFQRADENERPSFNIVFQEQGTNTVAVAFFPGEYVKGYSRVTVYDSGVLPQNSTSLSNILCHEFGHVLGFRHSFALEKERQKQAGQVGEPDKKSIMSYKFPPKINLQDVQTSREVYENFTGGGTFDLDDGLGNQLEFMVRRVPA